jgi:hypothetical protein
MAGFALIEPARTALIEEGTEPDRAAAALDALSYVPTPPSARTDDAENAGNTQTPHNAQATGNVDIFIASFIKHPLTLYYHILANHVNMLFILKFIP